MICRYRFIDMGSRQSHRPVTISVFCVHRLPVSALGFLICDATDRCLRTVWRTCSAASDLTYSRLVAAVRRLGRSPRAPAQVPTDPPAINTAKCFDSRPPGLTPSGTYVTTADCQAAA